LAGFIRYEGTWKQVRGFNALHHWPQGDDEWEYPIAVEAARKAAIAFYEEKLAKGQIKMSGQKPGRSLEDEQTAGQDGEEASRSSMRVHGSDVSGYQSGIPGITWKKPSKTHTKPRWMLQYLELKTGKRVTVMFSLTKYIAQGMSADDARAAALKDAADARKEKIAKGLMKEADAKVYESRMKCVVRRAETKKNCAKGRHKLFALKASPKSVVPGIFWHKHKLFWVAVKTLNGKRHGICCATPLDASAGEIERTRLEAIAKLQKWLKEHGLPEVAV